MLTFQLTPYADASWTLVGGAYTAADGASRVTPIDHSMVEHTAYTDGQRVLIVIREKMTGCVAAVPGVHNIGPSQFDAQAATAADWPGDVVVISTAPDLPVTVTAGAARTTHLYLSAGPRSLHGSWDMADLKGFAGRLHAVEVARLLVFRPRYSTQTVFEGIQRLTERATAHFGGSLVISYPQPALHHDPRELAEGADVLGAFVELLHEALDAHPWDAESTVFHLSGGFDSGCIGTTAAKRRPHKVRTAALLIDGPGRAQQERRRAGMRDTLPFADDDTTVDAARLLPLDPECTRVQDKLISPYEEPLFYPFSLLTSALAAKGATAVVTGLGGDELVALSQEEAPHLDLNRMPVLPPWIGPAAATLLEYADVGTAPPAPINSMTLLALESTAPPLLRSGIWPIHPFAWPALVEFGEQLPYDWRDFKQLQRRLLESLGLGMEVVRPVHRESFAEIVERALTGSGVTLLERMLADGSPLFDDRLVNPDAVSAAVKRMQDGNYAEGEESKLLEVVHLDLATRAFLS
ncbi:asparagine synthase-related protein [Catenulispora rubra]|uniref:asparagine synthase-related protein n=1 Tax=Catenulispora rubra TaxID=280293 RepID=UPI0018923CAC|nr:asparagine synthase-related protein [Catenulispora rubra]